MADAVTAQNRVCGGSKEIDGLHVARIHPATPVPKTPLPVSLGALGLVSCGWIVLAARRRGWVLVVLRDQFATKTSRFRHHKRILLRN